MAPRAGGTVARRDDGELAPTRSWPVNRPGVMHGDAVSELSGHWSGADDAQRRLRAVSDAARLTHVEVDFAAGRLRVADNFGAILGIGAPAAPDLSLDEGAAFIVGHVVPEDRARLAAALARFLAGDDEPSLCVDVQAADPPQRSVEMVFAIERGPAGAPLVGFATCIDVTERVRSARVLRESEARYRSALRAGRMGAWETDYVEATRTWSPEGMALFGLSLPDGRGRVGGAHDEFQAALHPLDRHLVQRFRALADTEDAFPAEYRIVRPDGSMLWLAGRGLVVSRRPDGRAHRLVSIMADVTERRGAEELLRIERERVALALQAGLMGAFDFDLRRGALWWSPRTYEIFGVPPERFTPSPESVGACIHPDDRERFLRQRAQAIARHQPLQLEFRIVRPDGSVVWVAHRGQTDYDASGAPVRHYGIVMDITERRLAEQALRDADRQKDQFVATLAHELRNPLAPIRNAVTLMRRLPLDAPRIAWCRDVIERQVGQMARLLDDLLDLSRMTRDQLELRPEPLALATVVERALEIAQPVIDAAGHAIDVELPAQPVHFVGDPARLAQVFSNLLINAAKYTPPGGQLSLGACLQGDELQVRVSDEGIGIPPEHLPRIFDMFTQVDPSRDRSQAGLGIGLALSRRLVEMHGGQIVARSDGAGRGSEFLVRLPIAATPTGVSVPAERARAGPAGRPLRILVADDLRDGADSLAMALEAMGHEVRVAYDGDEAVRLGAAFLPHVALLDLGMPAVDGFEACRRIRAAPWGGAVMLIAQSGWGREADRARTRDAGFDHHLVKPIHPGALAPLLDAVAPDLP